MMDLVGGIYIPRAEKYLRAHLAETPGFADNYDTDLHAFVDTLPRKRIAVDVGASIGLWSRRLAGSFGSVHAYEPLPIARECFLRNVEASNVYLHAAALGDRDGTVTIENRPSITFKTHVSGSSGSADIRTLDSFDIKEVDLIKIDCEGFDYWVLRGAEQTIRRDRPLVIFEAKEGVSERRYRVAQTAPHDFMRSLGYVIEAEVRGNAICRPQ